MSVVVAEVEKVEHVGLVALDLPVGESGVSDGHTARTSERERLTKVATDFGWHSGFAQEPDGSWFWLVLDAETDEPIKAGTAPSWQDALIDCVKDLSRTAAR